MRPAAWTIRGGELSLAAPVVMGIVNVTPDSFSDGGDHLDPSVAIAAGLAMIADGAAIVDVGGESTRPGSMPVSIDEELLRVLPVVSALVDGGVTVSIDTTKAEVARRCIAAGAHIVNDVTALSDPAMAGVCADGEVGVVLMHMLGTPADMQHNPTYVDVVAEVGGFLDERAEAAVSSGIAASAVAIDPGIGFGKTYTHNTELMRHLGAFTNRSYPVVIGASRKGFLGSILKASRGETTAKDRDGATAATVALGVSAGVSVFRVHNVRLGADVATTANAMVPREAHEQETYRT
jgi:dihydropteroate synthase